LGSGNIEALSRIDSVMEKMEPYAYINPIQLGWFTFCESLPNAIQNQLHFDESRKDKILGEDQPFIYEMRLRELINDPILNTLKSAFTHVLYSWMSAICCNFDIRTLPALSEVYPFVQFLLEDPENLHNFWHEDAVEQNRLYKILENLEQMFPVEAADLLNFLTKLCGTPEFQYSKEVIAHLDNMIGYTHILENSDDVVPASEEFPGSVEKRQFSHMAKRDINIEGLKIPEKTRMQILDKRKYNQMLVRWEIKYSAWPILCTQIEEILNKEMMEQNFSDYLFSFIKLLCKLISLNPAQAAILDDLISPEQIETERLESSDFAGASRNKILSIFGKCLFHCAKIGREDSLVVAQNIIQSISKLYESEELKPEVLRFIDNMGEKYILSKFTVRSQAHPLIILLKNFREQEISLRNTTLSQAVLDFTSTLLTDTYLQNNFGLEPQVYFLRDLLQFVFDDIVRNFDSCDSRNPIDCIMVMQGVLKLMYIILLKYRSSPTKLRLDYSSQKQQQFMNMLTHLMNRVNIPQILLRTIWVKLTFKSLSATSKSKSENSVLAIQNQFWHELLISQKLGVEEKIQLKRTIALSLSCISLILGMVYQQKIIFLQQQVEKDKKIQNAPKKDYKLEEYFQQLGAVGDFYNYFYDRAELPVFSVETTRQIERTPINFVLAIANYVSFESDNYVEMDYDLKIEDSLLPAKQYIFNVNQSAISCLSKLILIWELYSNTNRPSLLAYLDFSKSNLYGQADLAFGTVNFDLNCQAKLKEEFFRMLSGYAMNPSLSNSVLELLIVAIYSQRGFTDFMLRSEVTGSTSGYDFMTIMAKTLSEQGALTEDIISRVTKVYGNYAILMSSLFENEAEHKSLISSLRKHKIYKQAFTELHKSIHKIFTAGNAGSNVHKKTKDFISESNKSYKLHDIRKFNNITEDTIKQECFRLYTQLSYSNVLIYELMKAGNENNEMLSNILTDFIGNYLPSIFDRLSKDGLSASTWENACEEYNDLRSYQTSAPLGSYSAIPGKEWDSTILATAFSDFGTAIYAWTLSNNASGISGKWVWHILESVNEYGYGKNWCIDTSELWTESISMVPVEMCQRSTFTMSKYNMEASLQDIETKFLIYINQLMTVLVSDLEMNQLQISELSSATRLWGERQDWTETIHRYEQMVAFFWESVREKFNLEVLAPMDLYKLQQKLSSVTICFNGLSLAYRRQYESDQRKTQEERKQMESQSAAEKRLAEIIPDLPVLLRSSVMPLFNKYANEQLLLEYNTMLVAYLQFLHEAQFILNKEQENALLTLVPPLGEELEFSISLSSQKNDMLQTQYFPFVIAALEQIIGIINDELYVKIFDIDHAKIIRVLLNRLTSKNCSNVEFLAALKFFTKYASNMKGAQHLFEQKIIQSLCMAPIFNNLLTIPEYENNEKSPIHILWCWTLFFMTALFSNASQVPGFFDIAIGFLKTYEERIVRTLQFKGYYDTPIRPIQYSLAVFFECHNI